MELDQLERVALALAIGFLVGVERGWHARDVEEGGRTAGLRTFALTGLLGGVAGLLSQSLGAWAFVGVALPFAGAFTYFKWAEQKADKDYSVTAVVAALLVFALGAYAVVGDWHIAAVAAVVTTGLLAFKGVLHGWLKSLTWPELRSALILLAMSVVVLPLLPNQGYGPYGAFNPSELWMLTIVLAGISFAAYVLVKVLGPSRGLVAASLAGSLVSSTATTLNAARIARKDPALVRLAAGCALLAGGVMATRMLVIVAALAPELTVGLAWTLGVFAAVSALAGLAAIGRKGLSTATGEAWPMKSPFELSVVVQLAVVLGAVMAAARVLSALYGAAGLLPLSAVAALVDVDAVALATARMAANGALNHNVALQAILIAAAAGSTSKSVVSVFVGGRAFGLIFIGGTLLAAAAAVAALLLGPTV